MGAAGLASKNQLRIRWIVFASGQRLSEEYGTTASAGISAALEDEVRTLCREFHTAVGVQEVPSAPPVLLFWKARKSQDWIITQVARAPRPAGHRVAYEYFSLVFSDDEFQLLGRNPLRALELNQHEELRELCKGGGASLLTVSLSEERSGPERHRSGGPAPDVVDIAEQFHSGGILPATRANREALPAYVDGAFAEDECPPTFATWWPSGQLPPSGDFAIILQAVPPRVLKPHEVTATVMELNACLKQALPPPGDSLARRCFRSLLDGADQLNAIIDHAYLPAALDESPAEWTSYPQQAAALCQRMAGDLQSYARGLPLGSDEDTIRLIDLAKCYLDFARDLQKLKHPNLLRTAGGAGLWGVGQGADHGASRRASRDARRKWEATGEDYAQISPAILVAGIVGLCVVVLGARTFLGVSSSSAQNQGKVERSAASHSQVARNRDGYRLPPQSREQSALAQMRKRADLEVGRVARDIAKQRVRTVNGLSEAKIERAVLDAVAQAMAQTPYNKIDGSQKGMLLQMATDEIRAKALEGVQDGIRQRVQSLQAVITARERRRQRGRERAEERRQQVRRRRQKTRERARARQAQSARPQTQVQSEQPQAAQPPAE